MGFGWESRASGAAWLIAETLRGGGAGDAPPVAALRPNRARGNQEIASPARVSTFGTTALTLGFGLRVPRPRRRSATTRAERQAAGAGPGGVAERS